MTDETPERIRELQLKISQWTKEQDHTIQQHRDDLEMRRDALRLSSKVMAFGSIPAMIWILYVSAVTFANSFTVQQVCFCIFELVVFGILATAGARVSGLFAHWWFRRSFIRERTAVVVITLAVVALQLLWVIYYADAFWPYVAIQ